MRFSTEKLRVTQEHMILIVPYVQGLENHLSTLLIQTETWGQRWQLGRGDFFEVGSRISLCGKSSRPLTCLPTLVLGVSEQEMQLSFHVPYPWFEFNKGQGTN